MFCDESQLAEAVAEGKQNVLLQSLKAFSPEVREAAMDFLPLSSLAYFEGKLKQGWRCVGYDGELCSFALTHRGGVSQTMGRMRACRS